MGGHVAQKLGDGLMSLFGRRDKNRTRVCQGLHPCRDVGSIAKNLARGIQHNRTGFEADAGVENWLASGGIGAVELVRRTLDGKCCPRCAFGVVLVC
jgi:hypothetical protein